MFDFNSFLETPPYSLDKKTKGAALTAALKELTEHHMVHCEPYARMMKAQGFDPAACTSFEQIPFLPVSLFKDLDLRSIPQEEVFKTLTSSGTTGQAVSKIYLNREAAAKQQKTLVKIVSSFTGAARMPMLIIDSPSVIKNRAMFSARGAGILGFSIFGADRTYALDDDMNLDLPAIQTFLDRHKGQKILLFGFTFMVWQHFYKALLSLNPEPGTQNPKLETRNPKLDLSNGILIHGGGWKKLVSEAVSPAEFQQRLTDVCGLHDVHDYYGMVEQTGCVYMQCECGHLHASIFSDVLIRRPNDFSLADVGETGIIQVVSVLPDSYPGHSLLTEDEGILLGEDNCPCGRLGKYFKIIGRLKNAEIRGCSDTYAAGFKLKS